MTERGGQTAISVVIPTRNRREHLPRILDALAAQAFDHARLEVIVVADGCSDGTTAVLSAREAPHRLVVLDQLQGGAAAARNAGAAVARGTVLLFLDDDVEPTANLVAAHAARHAAGQDMIVLGPYPPAPHASARVFRMLTRHFWARHFAALAEPGHRFNYRDVLTGNMSIPTRLWRRMGGLDPRFRSAREDYEFGIRAIAADVPLVFAPEAIAWHHEHDTATLHGAFRRAYEEGRMDALIAEKHPEVVPGLPLAWTGGRKRRGLERAIFALGPLLQLPVRGAQGLLPTLDRLGLRSSFIRLFSELRRYWYVRGFAAHFRTWAAWQHALREPPTIAPEIALNLREGLDAAMAKLDQIRPRCAVLHFGSEQMASLASLPGSERWRGAHLKPYLLRGAASAYLQALAREGEIMPGTTEQREALAQAVSAAMKPSSTRDPYNIWHEQHTQWTRAMAADDAPRPRT